MAEKTAKEKLRAILADCTWGPRHEKWVKAPFRCGKYICATDGCFLVAIKDGADAPVPPAGHLCRKSLPKYLAAKARATVYDLDHLKAWADRGAHHSLICRSFFGKVINLALIHRAVKPFSGTYQIGGRPGKETEVVITGQGWKAIIMPMRGDPDEKYEKYTPKKVKAPAVRP